MRKECFLDSEKDTLLAESQLSLNWDVAIGSSLDDTAVPSSNEALTADTVFDLDSFFSLEAQLPVATADTTAVKLDNITDKPVNPPLNLVVELQKHTVLATELYKQKITEDNFAKALDLSSTFFSGLSMIIGSCGPLCLHAISSISQLPTAGMNAVGVGGWNSTDSVEEIGYDPFAADKSGLSFDRSTFSSTGNWKLHLFELLNQSLADGIEWLFGMQFVGGFLSIFDSLLAPQQTQV